LYEVQGISDASLSVAKTFRRTYDLEKTPGPLKFRSRKLRIDRRDPVFFILFVLAEDSGVVVGDALAALR